MSQLAVVFLLLFATVLITPLADRLRLPYPVLITVFGLILAVIPNTLIPPLHLAPELILPLVLPPLLYAATQRSSWRIFLTNARPILLLAVALVFVSTAAVAAVARLIMPGLPIAAAIALGAIVAAPDAAAATSVANRLGLPRRLVALIEGEGLFNDVTALTLYQVAVAGVVTGSFSVLGVAGRFVYSALAATAIGLLIGLIARFLLRWLPTATLQSALSLLVPFVSYVAAERLEASGVLAVLATGFYLGYYAADPDDAERRLQSRSFWEVVELLVTGFAFGLIGLELTVVLAGLETGIGQVLTHAGIVCAVVIVIRIGWMLAAGWLSKARQRHTETDPTELTGGIRNWRESVVLSWAGMRGVVTVATALALPLTTSDGGPFPQRAHILLIAFAVILATLVVQGISLPWMVRKLGVSVGSDRQRRREREIANQGARAAMRRLTELEDAGQVPQELAERLRAWYQVALGRMRTVEGEVDDSELERRIALRGELAELESELLAVARREVLTMRLRGADPAAADRVLRRLDMRTVQRG